MFKAARIAPSITTLPKPPSLTPLPNPRLPQVDDVSFVIRKVAYQYQYIGGAYRMVSKAAKVKKTSRDSVERFMERLLPKGSRDDKN